MARSWLIDSRGIAKKVKNPTYSNYQIKEWGLEANRQCPNCSQRIDNSDVAVGWPGLPAGVKFDPSDVELLEHLAGKVGLNDSKSHLFIDEFIPTLDEQDGICYTHPQNLPGVKKDGGSAHFFHRAANAYSTGQRKRRKIHNKHGVPAEHIRWHKTGKTKPVIDNGIQKGFKKIMVLYRSSKKGSKPDRANWVMHQYHIGTEEDEKDGEFVVSKVFYQMQAKETEKAELELVEKESDILTSKVIPRTPKTNTPHPPRLRKQPLYNEDEDEDAEHQLPGKDAEFMEPQLQSSPVHLEEIQSHPAWWAGQSHAAENPNSNFVYDLLLCHEELDCLPSIEDSGLASCGIPDLDNIELDTPPDFQLADLQFGSQDSWFDRL
ncbi:NAC domain-containing protein 8 [Acorus gramineus]|uniref:NAC domain-containing protein 8 n=1 Tax=Acorus gramineus TaxID=55184 RepID=A0AAV9B454_ACOGR|nr:NAC domain-containing protein 8 [Acorus gramineus]